ncbi:ArpA protein [Kitasatospora sp. NPDC059327]|uniref:HalD/BesD family halogenase n=1 Tax=Kitasatospora sp. NPDC059327 TaxID=3346803 RepID=UPI0036BF86C6
MNVQQINEDLAKFLAEHHTPESVSRLADRFHRLGFVKFDAANRLVPNELQTAVREETDRLIDEHKERRNLLLSTTGNTPRRMSVVKSEEIEKSELISTLSRSEVLLGFLADITREEILPQVSDDERYLITHQEFKSDTHGWHWGDYSFALIWALRMPPVEHGGMLQAVPHTHWDKSDPRINQTLCEREIHTHGLESGDLYLLRTDTTLHRTVPLSEDSTRTILNMTWAAKRDLEKDLVGDDRWWDNPEVQAARTLDND